MADVTELTYYLYFMADRVGDEDMSLTIAYLKNWKQCYRVEM